MSKGRNSSRLAMQRAIRRDFAYRCRLGPIDGCSRALVTVRPRHGGRQ